MCLVPSFGQPVSVYTQKKSSSLACSSSKGEILPEPSGLSQHRNFCSWCGSMSWVLLNTDTCLCVTLPDKDVTTLSTGAVLHTPSGRTSFMQQKSSAAPQKSATAQHPHPSGSHVGHPEVSHVRHSNVVCLYCLHSPGASHLLCMCVKCVACGSLGEVELSQQRSPSTPKPGSLYTRAMAPSPMPAGPDV